jgi:putative ABC transport system permease protein
VTLFLRLALRNVFRHRARTVVALGAIAAGCAALIVNGGVIYNIFAELREDAIRGRHGHLQIYRAGYSDGYRSDPWRYLLPRDEADRIVAMARELPEVERAAMRREFYGMIASGDRYVAFVGVGVDADEDAEMSRHVAVRAGEPLSSADAYGAIFGLGLAERFDGRPGDVVTLMTNTETGALNAVDVRVRGVFEGGMKAYDDWTLKVPIGAASELLLDDRVEAIVLLLDDTEAVPAVRDALDARLRDVGLDVEIRTWRDLALFHNQTVSLFSRELDVIKLIVATIVVLGIANTIGMSILERRVELATLRALGLAPRAIAMLLACEAAITGLLGGAIGIAAGAVIARVVTAIGIPFPSPPGSTRPFLGGVDFVPEVAASAFAISLAATLVASILPITRAIRRPIAPTLRGT